MRSCKSQLSSLMVCHGNNFGGFGQRVFAMMGLIKEEELLPEARLQSLRGAIQKGIDQAERGELLDGEEVMAELRSRILNRKS